MESEQSIGLGERDFMLAAYIENRPAFMGLAQLQTCQPLVAGEISAIGQACGNGWRKVFNVYAKLIDTLPLTTFNLGQQQTSWQAYRDELLLQSGSQTALLFSPPVITPERQQYHLIMGRTYAKKLVDQGLISSPLTWLDNEFAINRHDRVIVCPYFDYRQLSNIKITHLSELMQGL
ncbi:DUF6942 family protein [Shewanella marina]|uniref:DUF6942 family protein n=1 Tax=Shewanella marina TaxID=487319 RepID=UPI00046F10DA